LPKEFGGEELSKSFGPFEGTKNNPEGSNKEWPPVGLQITRYGQSSG